MDLYELGRVAGRRNARVSLPGQRTRLLEAAMMTMRRLLGVFALLLMLPLVGVDVAPAVLAQEGHPLVGTWHGTWGPNAKERHDVTLVLEYDGKAITGMMNPGPDSVRFDKVTLDPTN